MTKSIILPTSFTFNLTLTLYHFKGNRIKIDFDKNSQSMLSPDLQRSFHPSLGLYNEAINRTSFKELKDAEAKRFAIALRKLSIENIERLTQGQAKAKADQDEFASTAAYLIDWAQDVNEIQVGSKGKVLIHCLAEKVGKSYKVSIEATSPLY